ncbi:MAG: hypothetical protein EOO75_08265 [Myxococcales bacterium]|nr:MAG: hypothetical protein EOO75_08265 [Myxococcales bacterium]
MVPPLLCCQFGTGLELAIPLLIAFVVVPFLVALAVAMEVVRIRAMRDEQKAFQVMVWSERAPLRPTAAPEAGPRAPLPMVRRGWW